VALRIANDYAANQPWDSEAQPQALDGRVVDVEMIRSEICPGPVSESSAANSAAHFETVGLFS
jgi:hypothetical protein